jgi:hypothetical protein
MRLLTETPTHHPKNPVNSENSNHPTQGTRCNPGGFGPKPQICGLGSEALLNRRSRQQKIPVCPVAAACRAGAARDIDENHAALEHRRRRPDAK